MKHISILVTILVSGVLFVASCSKDDSTHCTFVSPQMVFNGYTADDLDTVIIRKYEKGAGFIEVLDSTLISKGELSYKLIGEDSMTINSTVEGYKIFQEQLYTNDWEIYIPSNNAISRIEAVTPKFFSKTDPGEECRSYVTSMIFEGSTRTFTTWHGATYRIHTTK